MYSYMQRKTSAYILQIACKCYYFIIELPYPLIFLRTAETGYDRCTLRRPLNWRSRLPACMKITYRFPDTLHFPLLCDNNRNLINLAN